MQDTPNSNSNDGIDLRELVLILWAYKFLIASICALSIAYSGYYALSLKKEFTSIAIFKLDSEKSGGFSYGSDLELLNKFAGFGPICCKVQIVKIFKNPKQSQTIFKKSNKTYM